jgi:serine/threonine protein kinase
MYYQDWIIYTANISYIGKTKKLLILLVNKYNYFRDLKLDNLALLADNIKIVDFGSAIKLDHTMKLPFAISTF